MTRMESPSGDRGGREAVSSGLGMRSRRFAFAGFGPAVELAVALIVYGAPRPL
ncbi:MAG: hypothetical protein IH822_07095 [Chloroflexi bacterium]|nr:hypothetical protein [Chloroflexota bacterium]